MGQQSSAQGGPGSQDRVRVLHLEGKSITDELAETLAEGIAHSCTLEQIFLPRNLITSRGAEALASGIERQIQKYEIREGHSQPGLVFELDLSSNRIGDDGAKALARACHASSSRPPKWKTMELIPSGIEKLHLHDTCIGVRGTEHFNEALALRSASLWTAASVLTDATEEQLQTLQRRRLRRLASLEILGLDLDPVMQLMSKDAEKALKEKWPKELFDDEACAGSVSRTTSPGASSSRRSTPSSSGTGQDPEYTPERGRAGSASSLAATTGAERYTMQENEDTQVATFSATTGTGSNVEVFSMLETDTTEVTEADAAAPNSTFSTFFGRIVSGGSVEETPDRLADWWDDDEPIRQRDPPLSGPRMSNAAFLCRPLPAGTPGTPNPRRSLQEDFDQANVSTPPGFAAASADADAATSSLDTPHVADIVARWPPTAAAAGASTAPMQDMPSSASSSKGAGKAKGPPLPPLGKGGKGPAATEAPQTASSSSDASEEDGPHSLHCENGGDATTWDAPFAAGSSKGAGKARGPPLPPPAEGGKGAFAADAAPATSSSSFAHEDDQPPFVQGVEIAVTPDAPSSASSSKGAGKAKGPPLPPLGKGGKGPAATEASQAASSSSHASEEDGPLSPHGEYGGSAVTLDAPFAAVCSKGAGKAKGSHLPTLGKGGKGPAATEASRAASSSSHASEEDGLLSLHGEKGGSATTQDAPSSASSSKGAGKAKGPPLPTFGKGGKGPTATDASPTASSSRHASEEHGPLSLNGEEGRSAATQDAPLAAVSSKGASKGKGPPLPTLGKGGKGPTTTDASPSATSSKGAGKVKGPPLPPSGKGGKGAPDASPPASSSKGAGKGKGPPPPAGGKGTPPSSSPVKGEGKAAGKGAAKGAISSPWQKVKALAVNNPFGKKLHLAGATTTVPDGSIFSGLGNGRIEIGLLKALMSNGDASPSSSSRLTDRRKAVSGIKKPTGLAVLDGPRAQNMGIVLKRLSVTPKVLCKSLRDLNFTDITITPDEIELVMGVLPTADESRKLLEHLPVLATLRDVEQQVMPFCELPKCNVRLQLMKLALSHSSTYASLRDKCKMLRRAADEAQNSEELRDLLNMVVLLGNYVNHGVEEVQEGGMRAFAIESLGSLASLRNGSVSSLHFLCLSKQFKDTTFLEAFQKSLSNVPAAAKENSAALRAAVEAFRKDVNFAKVQAEQLLLAADETLITPQGLESSSSSSASGSSAPSDSEDTCSEDEAEAKSNSRKEAQRQAAAIAIRKAAEERLVQLREDLQRESEGLMAEFQEALLQCTTTQKYFQTSATDKALPDCEVFFGHVASFLTSFATTWMEIEKAPKKYQQYALAAGISLPEKPQRKSLPAKLAETSQPQPAAKAEKEKPARSSNLPRARRSTIFRQPTLKTEPEPAPVATASRTNWGSFFSGNSSWDVECGTCHVQLQPRIPQAAEEVPRLPMAPLLKAALGPGMPAPFLFF